MAEKVTQSTKSKRISLVSVIMISLTLILILGVFVLSYITRLKLEDKSQLIIYANQLRSGSQLLTSEVRGYAATGEQQHYDNYWNEVNNTKSRDDAIANMKKIGITIAEMAQIEDIGNQSNQLIPLEEEVMASVAAGDLSAAVAVIYGSVYQKGIDKISADTQRFIQEMDERVTSESNRDALLSMIVSVLAALSLLYTIYMQYRYQHFVKHEVMIPVTQLKEQMQYIAQCDFSQSFQLSGDNTEIGQLVHSIHQTKKSLKYVIDTVANLLQRMAEKDFNINVNIEFIGEFKHIKNSLNTIVDTMNETLTVVKDTTSNVVNNSVQMAQVSNDLAENSVNQMTIIDEIGNAIQQIADSSLMNSNKAAESLELVQKASDQLNSNNQKMQQLKTAIQIINESANQINGITQVISEIAEQTNLLALNAAIEAARAGDSGKGFGVVANEVKNLANESAKAVNSTDELIQQVIKNVMDGNRFADEMVISMNEVLDQENNTAEMIRSLAETTRLQVDVIHQVTDNMEVIHQSVESLSSTAEETAAASIQQEQHTTELENLIQDFQIRK